MIYLKSRSHKHLKISMRNNFHESIKLQIEHGINILNRGGVIAFPTETVYGLGVSIGNARAAERIFQIKGRAHTKALPLVISRIEQLQDVAINIPEIVQTLGNAFWPGPLTLILFKSRLVPDVITSGGNTVAVRVSPHPIAIALVEGLGMPITGTSANISGKPSPITADDVETQLGNTVDYVVNGGRCPGGIESTIIDVTKEIPVIIREGAIHRDTICQVCQVI